MYRFGKVSYEEAYRLVAFAVRYAVVVVKHQYHPAREFRKVVHERGKRRFDEVGPHHAQAREGVGPEPFLRRDPTQGLDDVLPQPGRIVVLLVEGDPGEGLVGP